MREKTTTWQSGRELPARKRAPNRISHSEKDKGYRHIEKDLVLHDVCGLIEQSGLSSDKAAEPSGVSRTTLMNRLFGRTQRPQNATISFVPRSLRVTRRYVAVETGQPIQPPDNWQPRVKLMARDSEPVGGVGDLDPP